VGFFSRLENRARLVNSLVCAGLDPHISELRQPTATSMYDFCIRIIEATADLVAAFKPNLAFFTAFGWQGMETLQRVIAAIPPDVPVILDAKFGDISSTAEAYAETAFSILRANAITANPYLGQDSLTPFLHDPEKGVFLLCRTSNPGASDIQDLSVVKYQEQEELVSIITEYELVADLAQKWNVQDNLGLVVGATNPDALLRVRRWAPELWILAPGIGAQGGDLAQTLKYGLRGDKHGLLLPVSRAISQAQDARQAVISLRDEINHLRDTAVLWKSETIETQRDGLADGLLNAGCVRFGQFTLKSGVQSPIYFDLRRLVSYPNLLVCVAKVMIQLLSRLSFDRVAAIPYAAIPIATAISIESNWPMIYPRREVKTYGTKAQIEGICRPGETAVLIDDLATTGGSKFEAIEKLHSAELNVRDVVVLIDRQSGAAQALAQKGYKLHTVYSLTQLMDYWLRTNQITSEQHMAVKEFIAHTKTD